MVSLTDEQYADAARHGREIEETEPQASSAHYDRKTGRVAVELTNGCTYIFPTEIVQDLAEADPDGLTQIEVQGAGFDLYWPLLEVDLYVPALISGVFGTRDWMNKALARKAGSSTSEAKAAAARENGRKGGRPRKRA